MEMDGKTLKTFFAGGKRQENRQWLCLRGMKWTARAQTTDSAQKLMESAQDPANGMACARWHRCKHSTAEK
jgi:hypothetical protein